MATLRSPPLYPGKYLMGLPTVPFTTVQDNLYLGPAPKLPEQLLVFVEMGIGYDNDEHVSFPRERAPRATDSSTSLLWPSHGPYRLSFRSAKITGDLAWQIAVTGEGYLLAGDIDNATRFADRSLRLARDARERGNEAQAQRLLGAIASRRDPPQVARAKDHYHRALALADELGLRPLLAHCHLGLGKLYRRTGNGEQAQEHLTTATTMYCEMGMTYWLEQAEAELQAVP